MNSNRQEGIWKRSLRSLRSFLQSEQLKRDLATGLVEKQREAGGNMKELIHKQPPDRSRQVMSRAFWLTVERQEEIWKRSWKSSRSFFKTWKRSKGSPAAVSGQTVVQTNRRGYGRVHTQAAAGPMQSSVGQQSSGR